MRNIIVSNMVSLDGFYADPKDEIDWHVVSDEFFQDANALLDSVDTLLFGRITYQGMLSFWTSQDAITNDAIIASKMNERSKVVFSRTLNKVEWGKWDNAVLAKGDIGDAVRKLKQQPGKDMVIFGSGTIVAALAGLGLIDDYRIFVCPVALGSGKSMFDGLDHRVSLKLVKTKTYQSGVVCLFYQP